MGNGDLGEGDGAHRSSNACPLVVHRSVQPGGRAGRPATGPPPPEGATEEDTASRSPMGSDWHATLTLSQTDLSAVLICTNKQKIDYRNYPPLKSPPLQTSPPQGGDRYFTVLLGNIYCTGLCSPFVTHMFLHCFPIFSNQSPVCIL